MAFMAAGKVTSDNLAALEAYLTSGRFGGAIVSPDKAEQALKSSLALYKCVHPNDEETRRFKERNDLAAEVLVDVVDALACQNFVTLTEEFLQLDLAKAGTAEMKKSLKSIDENFRGVCEETS